MPAEALRRFAKRKMADIAHRFKTVRTLKDMAQEEIIKQFGAAKIRMIWDEEQEKYFFSVVDVIRVLNETDYQTARKYWKVLKGRLQQEGFESVTNCYQLKMTSPNDGKKYLTDVADKEQLFRIIQSVPSKKAEPVKQWLAKVGAERLDQMQDPERNLQQMVADYKRLGESVISPKKAIDIAIPKDELPFPKKEK